MRLPSTSQKGETTISRTSVANNKTNRHPMLEEKNAANKPDHLHLEVLASEKGTTASHERAESWRICETVSKTNPAPICTLNMGGREAWQI